MNETIITQFKLLVKQIQNEIDIDTYIDSKNKIANTFRLKSILKIIKQLEKYDKKINLDNYKNLEKIDGIGKNTIKRIEEILKTGKLSEIKSEFKTMEKYLNFFDELENVFGIGKKKAYELFNKFNITSIQELQNKVKSGDIKLPDNIMKGLKYVDKIKENIPRHDIDFLTNIMIDITYYISPKLYGITCGSYRRMKSTSNDIDFIIVHSDMRKMKDIENSDINYLSVFINKLKEKNIIVDSLTDENVKTKYMGICNVNNMLHRIDIRYIPFDSYYPAILYFTGSKELNTKMRQIAITLNYSLNEYGLYDENNREIIVNSESEIFEKLGMEYLSPELR